MTGSATVPHTGVNAGVAPVTYGEGSRPPRGDYASARPDYTCEQLWATYTAAEHERYARLHARQVQRLHGLACSAFVDALPHLGDAAGVPRFDDINARLQPATGWQVVAVPGLIPEEAFFALLANRRFPVTRWLRDESELDYVIEPDLFHDLFGHVPLLFDPVFADYMQAYGRGGLKAVALGACEMLARLYWYTVEFGLIDTPDGVRAYGAGLLSSGGELLHSVQSPSVPRLGFDLLRLMRSRYRIDSYQGCYFVIEGFDQLFAATAPDFAPAYRQVATLPALEPAAVLPGERTYPPSA